MFKRCLMSTVAIALVAAAASTAYAADCSTFCDSTLRAGQVFEADSSAVIYGGGSAAATRVWTPFLLDDLGGTGALLNNSLLNIVDGRVLGGLTSYGTTSPIRTVVCFGLADQFDAIGTYTSHDIVIFETLTVSDTVGQMLPDGSLVWRANFGGAGGQNGIEWAPCVAGQQTPIQEPAAGTQTLAGPGVGDPAPAGSAYIGTPGAQLGGSGFYVGNTNYDAGTGNIPVGANIWDYNKVTPSSSLTPTYTYTQAGAETFANANGVVVGAGGGRQTQPAFGSAEGVKYTIFGINDTTSGGSARPQIFAVDAYEDGDAFTGAVPIVAPVGYKFIDHQANGGGSNVYENTHFDMNNVGQVAAVTESYNPAIPNDPNHVPTYQALVYDPIITAGRITGYSAPLVVADAGPLEVVPQDGLVGPFFYDPDPNDAIPGQWVNALSGVAINDAGNVAFCGLYDTGEPLDPNNPGGPTRWDDAVYFYDAASTTLHQVLRESDVIANVGNPLNPLALGPIVREDSDAFMGANMADGADVICVNFRSNRDVIEGFSRGVAVVAVGHIGDTNFDGNVNLADLAKLLSVYGSSFMTPLYDPQIDFDLNGAINLADLAALLAHYGT